MKNTALLLIGFAIAHSPSAQAQYSQKSTAEWTEYFKSISGGEITRSDDPELSSQDGINVYYANQDNDKVAPLVAGGIALQSYWSWKPNLSKSGNDALDHIREFYSKQTYVEALASYSRPYPYLSAWGQLFHPPVRQLWASVEKIYSPFQKIEKGSNAYFRSLSFHSRLDKVTGNELTSGNKTRLLQNNESFERKLKLVKKAKHSILISQLAVACDETGEPMFKALQDAQKNRKVDVRIMMDHLYAVVASSCVDHLRSLGIHVLVIQGASKLKIMKTTNHTSMWIVDGETVVIGAQNLAKANNASTGFNFLNRDTDLEVEGPVATDAMREYAEVWLENENTESSPVQKYIELSEKKLREERQEGVRGLAHYAKWLQDQSPTGICRMAFQRPQRARIGLATLLLESIDKANSVIQITTTQTKLSESGDDNTFINHIVRKLQQKAQNATPVRVDLIGNGVDGGNGELTMALKEKSEDAFGDGKNKTGAIYAWGAQATALSKAKANMKVLGDLAVGDLKTYAFFNFYHGKQWYFDRTALVIGSQNFDEESFESHYEGAVMCLDTRLNEEFEKAMVRDLLNSIPVVKTVTGP